jgi:hypothetical protein
MYTLYGTKDPDELDADQKNTIASIAGLIGTGVGATTGNVGNAVASGQLARNAVENNYLTAKQLIEVEKAMRECGDDDRCKALVVETARGVSRTQDFALFFNDLIGCRLFGSCYDRFVQLEHIEAGNDPIQVERFLAQLYPGLSPEQLKTATDYYIAGAKNSLENSTWNVIDSTLFFANALSPLAVGGKAISAAEKELTAEAAKVALKIDSPQLGKKLGKHVEDFGGNPANAADRQMVFNKINDIANHPDKVIPGTFSGQGVGGVRGDVIFNIKGSDVVITKPDGTFVTIMKDGVNNTSVQNALRGIK